MSWTESAPGPVPVLSSSPIALHNSHLPFFASVLVDLLVCSIWTSARHLMDFKAVLRIMSQSLGGKNVDKLCYSYNQVLFAQLWEQGSLT